MTTTQTRTQTRFVGVADWWGTRVWVEQGGTRRMLRPSGDDRLVAGFSWGRRGLETKNLAEAMLADATGNPMLAERLSRDLAIEVVAQLDESGFELGRDDVLAWVDARAAA